MKDVLVIKLGGMLLNNSIILDRFFKILHHYYNSINNNILIIHGGESWINYYYHDLCSTIDIDNSVYNNVKIHDNNKRHNFIKLGMLSGTINKNITLYAKKNNFNAVGLCLTDGNNITLDSSYTNNIDLLNNYPVLFIKYLFSKNIIPVISPIGITKENMLINIDSDLAAMLLTISLKAQLIILTDVNGILDGKGNKIERIIPSTAEELISSGIITDGMITKINTAMQVSKILNQSVKIASLIDYQILKEIFSGKSSVGTSVYINK